MAQGDKKQYTLKLNNLLRSVGLSGFSVHKHVLRDHIAPMAIVKLAKKQKIDLLVMGTVCNTGIAGFFIGNTAEKVLSEVNCSVLTVKPEGFITSSSFSPGFYPPMPARGW